MKLKRIELIGFKSFADKTVVDLSDGITSIVGPNGSGKSNIADCLAWVMGEQSARSLRGGNMQDVIFAGTTKRKPLAFTSVSITIDNSSGEFNLPYEEVTITRKLYRSGESEYSINGGICRLKDVHELLMDTGLGRDGYSIIGQGKISEILSNKAEDRRQVFEEAAGISKYRYRKEESNRKLAATEENLIRINDIAGEIEVQLEPLAAKSEAAKRYLALRDRLKILEITQSLFSLASLAESQKGEEEALVIAQNNEDELKAKIDEIDQKITSIYLEIDENEKTALEHSREQKRINNEIVEKKSLLEVKKANIENAWDSKRALKSEIADLEKRIENYDAGQENSISFLDTKIRSLENSLSVFHRDEESKSAEITQTQTELQTHEIAVANLEREFFQHESRLKVLADMQAGLEGLSSGVRHIMKSHFPGVIATVGQIFSTEEKYAVAIETALGGNVQNIVVDNEQTAKFAIAELKSQNKGRATFLPINSTYGNRLDNVPFVEGVIGIASDFVHTDDRFRNIAENLLGRIVVVDTLDNAITFSRSLGSKYRIVTLTGESLSPGGAITGGAHNKTISIFSRSIELENLTNSIKTIEAKVALEKAEKDRLSTSLAEQSVELEKIRGNISEATSDLTLLQQKKSMLTDQVKLLQEELERKTQALNDFDKNIELQGIELAELEKQSAELEESLKNMEAAVEKQSSSRKSSEENIKTLQVQQRSLSEQRLEIQKETSRLQARHEKFEADKDAILLHIWEEYELTLTEIEKYNVEENPVDSKKEIAQIKSQIKEIGNVDIDSIENYKNLSERFEFMDKQRSDLIEAKTNLEKVIADITVQMQEQFAEQFALINSEFKTVFAKLFGGGKAELSLTSDDNILESGVEIIAAPPGKAVQNISLLSGGEKALTAIAILLSLMRVRPAPFCILDEIDAALDDINVTRFAEYLKEYATGTQFILITHKRGTMEVSNMLYGVTMQEKGVSITLPLNLEQIAVKETKAQDFTIEFKTTAAATEEE